MAKYKLKKKTDLGTIFFHWTVFVLLFVSTVTGLRIGVAPSEGLIGEIERFFLTDNLWLYHLLAGSGMIALLAAYPVYMRRSGLARRITLDFARLYGLWTGGPARWAAINVILYWLLFGLIVFQIASGILMHRGWGGPLAAYHLWATYAVLIYAGAHVLAHFALGGTNQLLRVFRPAALPGAGPAWQGASSAEQASGRRPLLDPKTSLVLGSLAAGLGAIVVFFSADEASRDVLKVVKIDPSERPNTHPDLSDAAWRHARPIRISTSQGANFSEMGSSTIEISAVTDGERAWFAMTWQDPTRSLKHRPLVKQGDRWRLLKRQQDFGASVNVVQASVLANADGPSEDTYYEDRLALMFSSKEKVFGPGAFHVGKRPLADMPPSSSGRGLHYTTDGSVVEIIEWHADAGFNERQCDRKYIGHALPPTRAQQLGREIYRGGILAEPDRAPVMENIDARLTPEGDTIIRPRVLPKNLESVEQALQPINMDAELGEPEGARWWLEESETEPYSEQADQTIPVGTILPGIISRNIAARWQDLWCSARWSAGRWTLVMSRPLASNNAHDVSLLAPAYLWVAAFDHVPARHTRHVRPIRLEVSE